MCDTNTIIAEYKIGENGVWQTGTIINVNAGEAVYIRANVPSGEPYFVTLPFNQQNRFSSIADFPNFEDTTAYKIDTFNGGDGLIGSNNRGQYALTTAGGCVAVIDLKVIDDCSTIEQEYRINGVWQSGQSEITVDEGDEVVLSILPNGIGLSITLPDGSLRGGDFNLGNVTVADVGAYILTGDNDCSKTLQINVRRDLDCSTLSIKSTVNQIEVPVAEEISVNVGDAIGLSLNEAGIAYSITAPDGSLLAGDSVNGYKLNDITKEQEGVYLLKTVVAAENNNTVLFVDSEETSAEDGKAVNAIDGDPNTIWHTKWSTTNDSQPHEIQLDLGGITNVEGLTYLPRQNGSTNGTIANYEIYVTSDVSNWGEVVASGTWESNRTLKTVNFSSKEGKYVRLRSLSEINGNSWTSAAEINIIKGDVIGCTKTLEIKVQDVSCNIEPEYLVNQTWLSGASEITVNINDVMWLSMSPEDVDFTVTDPEGNTVLGNTIDGYYLGYMNVDKAGDYIFSTTNGCSKTLKINVAGNTCNIEPEYLVNDIWSSGESVIDVNANDVIWLSMSPENVAFSVTNPDGEAVIGDTVNGYYLGYMTVEKAGNYTFTTVDGCSKILKINVSGVSCNIEPEYLVNSSWSSGESEITLSVNDVVWLSMSPENLDFTVTDPQGDIILGNSIDGYYLGYMQVGQSGTYTFNTSNGCTSGLTINVVGTNLRVKLNGAKPIVDPEDFALYPNPSTGIFDIYLGEKLQGKPLEVMIYDLTGQRTYSKLYEHNYKGEIHTNVSTLADGLYKLIVNIKGEEPIVKSILIKK